MSVPFGRPGVKGDVHAINEKTKKKLGYEQLGYQVWFAEEEAGNIISQHVRSSPFPSLYFCPFSFPCTISLSLRKKSMQSINSRIQKLTDAWEKWEPFFNLVYPSNPQIWTTSFAPLGSLKRFLLANTEESSKHILAPWISTEAKDHHRQMFVGEIGEGGGYDAPLMWYKRGMKSLGWEEEREMLDRGEIDEGIKGKDVLMVGGLRDTVW